ncbi:MAG: hypothetical protein Q8N16_00790 [bacterium]|nr:hypothetical protein [bacterium]
MDFISYLQSLPGLTAVITAVLTWGPIILWELLIAGLLWAVIRASRRGKK